MLRGVCTVCEHACDQNCARAKKKAENATNELDAQNRRQLCIHARRHSRRWSLMGSASTGLGLRDGTGMRGNTLARRQEHEEQRGRLTHGALDDNS